MKDKSGILLDERSLQPTNFLWDGGVREKQHTCPGHQHKEFRINDI